MRASRASQRWIARFAGLLLLLCSAPLVHGWDAEQMLGAAHARGSLASEGAVGLNSALAALTGQPEPVKLAAINQFFNRRVRYAPDTEVWGQIDYWASPLETLSKGRGDCEDYVIAKYFALVASGVPVAKLRLVYVRASVGGDTLAHMVLAYYRTADAEPLILDNLIDEVRNGSQRPDLVPVFSFNGEGLWEGVGALRAGDPVARLSRWRDVLAKARAEGFQ